MTATMHPSETELVVVPKGRRSGSRGRKPRRPGVLKFGYWWWALPGIVFVIAIHYVATAAGGVFAFTDWTGIGDFDWIGLENFTKILSDPAKIAALGNTLFLAFGSVILSNIAGLALAIGLNRMLKTRYILRTLFFMPVVLSPLATSYIWKFIFQFDGPLNLHPHGPRARRPGPAMARRPGLGDLDRSDRRRLADDGLRDGHLHGGPRGRSGRDRRGRRDRRLQPVAAVLARHSAVDPPRDRHRDHPRPGAGPAHLRPDHGAHRRRTRRSDLDARHGGLQAGLLARATSDTAPRSPSS